MSKEAKIGLGIVMVAVLLSAIVIGRTLLKPKDTSVGSGPTAGATDSPSPAGDPWGEGGAAGGAGAGASGSGGSMDRLITEGGTPGTTGGTSPGTGASPTTDPFAPSSPGASPSPSSLGGPSSSGASLVDTGPTASPSLTSEPSETKTHTVVKGDTAETLAQKYYGTKKHANLIVKANPKVNFKALKAGATLKIPPRPAVGGFTSPTTPSTTASSDTFHREVHPLPGDLTGTGSSPGTGSGSGLGSASLPTTHTVVKGDTAYELSKKYYGDGKYFNRIVKANPTIDFDALKIGTKLNIPAAPAAGGSSTSISTAGSTSGAGASGSSLTGETTHTVVKGDTAYELSKKYYGDGKYFNRIVKANPGVNFDNLKVGATLKIPAASGSSTSTSGSGSTTTPPRTPAGPGTRPPPSGTDPWGAEPSLGGSPSSSPGGGLSATTPVDTGSSAAPAAGQKVHVVAEGDSLWTLASQYLGSGAKYPEILKANPGLTEKSMLRVGQKIFIPEHGSSASARPAASPTAGLPAAGSSGDWDR